MNRKKFYEGLSNELLGCFYFFIQDKMNKGLSTVTLQYEYHLIKQEAKRRGISLKELQAIGYWVIKREYDSSQGNN